MSAVMGFLAHPEVGLSEVFPDRLDPLQVGYSHHRHGVALVVDHLWAVLLPLQEHHLAALVRPPEDPWPGHQ